MTSLNALISRIKRSTRYNAYIVARLDQLLRSHSKLARAANAVLWVSFQSIRVTRHYLLSRRSKLKRPSSTSTKSTPLPWHASVEKNPVTCGVVIIAELSIPQCRRYRVDQKTTMFSYLGQHTEVVSWHEDERALSLLQTARLVIFYRTPATQNVQALIDEARRLMLPVIFDIDDLVFDVEAYSKNSNLQKLPDDEQKSLLEGAELYNRMLKLSDHAIASTKVLATYMQRYQTGTVHIVENGLEEYLANIDPFASMLPETDTVVIGYGSGTRTHDADFAQASTALYRIMERYSQVELAIIGHLTVPEHLTRFHSRIRRVPFMAAEDYYRSLQQFDINLAPLEPGIFNDAKSNIKYLEAAALCIPTVASPRDTFTDIIIDGENGFLADSEDEWFKALSLLVEQPPLRKDMGLVARDSVLKRYELSVLAEHQLLPLLQHASPTSVARHIMVVNVLFAPLSFGGATIVAEQLAKSLAVADDTRVTVVTGCFTGDIAPGEIRQYQWENLNVFAIGLIGGNKATEYQNPVAAEAFDTVLAATCPDIVHFHSIQDMGIGMTDACLSRHIPYLITLHDAWWLCERQFMINDKGYCGQAAIDPLVCAACVKDAAAMFHRRHLLQDTLNNAALLLSPSEFQRTLYVRSGCPENKVVVNKNGVLPPQGSQQTSQNTRSQLVFAYLGGVAEHKGYYWLKNIFRSIERSDYTLKLVDIQARFGRPTISAEEWNISGKVEIIYPFDSHEMDAFYDSIDVLLFPSQWKESFGLTVREAMLRDVWVISTECGGPTEDLVNGINGDTVAMSDKTGFREAILKCLDSPKDIKAYRHPETPHIRSFTEQAEELSGIIDQTMENVKNDCQL